MTEVACGRAAVALHRLELRQDDDPSGIRVESLSGGCIHEVWRVDFDRPSGAIDSVVMKMTDSGGAGAAMLASEAHGLERLNATTTVRVPAVFGIVRGDRGAECTLVMERLGTGRGTPSPEAWGDFGANLAALHLSGRDGIRRYGDDHDGFLGTTPQSNGWCDDWTEFVATRRLGPMLAALRECDLVRDGEVRTVKSVIDELDRLLVAKPIAAPLHGDLWSGNALATNEGIAVIDPAHFIGDPLAELAIMELFGGFPAVAFDAYRRAMTARVPDAFGRAETRIAVYRLHHLLNHVLIFGRGYADQALATATQLLRG